MRYDSDVQNNIFVLSVLDSVLVQEDLVLDHHFGFGYINSLSVRVITFCDFLSENNHLTDLTLLAILQYWSNRRIIEFLDMYRKDNKLGSYAIKLIQEYLPEYAI